MDVNGQSIHGTVRTPLDRQAWGDSTVKGSTLFLHVFQWPSDGRLVVGGLEGEVKGAHLLADSAKKALVAKRLNEKDVVVEVSGDAPDATDSVVVLEMDGPVKGSKGRLLATNVRENQLLAFDGKATGKFTYGDGKANRYYAAGFTHEGDAIVWPVRMNAAATFEVSVRYLAPEDVTLVVAAGDQRVSAMGKAAKTPQMVKLGELKLEAGECELRFATEKSGEVSLFEVVLKPVK
jgi:hypothetical protein